MKGAFILLSTCCIAVATADEVSPYAGDQNRTIKSLSEQEIRALRNGEGMGFARLAELNNYPGPRHVLDLAEELGLSEEQIRESQSLFAEMRASAVATGQEIIEAERSLDAQFAAQDVESDSLHAAITQVGLLRARLRYVHLEAHLRQRDLLTEEQIETYDQLRGYGNRHHENHESRRHNGHH